MKLDELEKRAIASGETVRFVEDGIEVVAVRADVFDRVRNVIYDQPLSADERQAALVQAGERAGWHDPEMDVYDELDPRRHD